MHFKKFDPQSNLAARVLKVQPTSPGLLGMSEGFEPSKQVGRMSKTLSSIISTPRRICKLTYNCRNILSNINDWLGFMKKNTLHVSFFGFFTMLENWSTIREEKKNYRLIFSDIFENHRYFELGNILFLFIKTIETLIHDGKLVRSGSTLGKHVMILNWYQIYHLGTWIGMQVCLAIKQWWSSTHHPFQLSVAPTLCVFSQLISPGGGVVGAFKGCRC